MDDSLKWARELVDQRGWVLHSSGIAGRVVDLYDGEGRRYVSPINDAEVAGPVLIVEPGHSFVADAGNFVRLSDRDARFHVAVREALRKTIEEVCRAGAAFGLRFSMAKRLMINGLRMQAAALEREQGEPVVGQVMGYPPEEKDDEPERSDGG